MTPSRFQIRQAARIIKSQGVITYPTEAVYGLGCDPLSEIAVKKILQLKRRPIEKGLILIASKIEQLEELTELSPADRKKINQHTTPVTWLVKKSSLTPHWISGNHDRVAVRISQHSVVQALCNEAGTAIVSTSTNTSRLKPATTLLQARRYFPMQLDYYLPGNIGELQQVTPIINIDTDQTIRA